MDTPENTHPAHPKKRGRGRPPRVVIKEGDLDQITTALEQTDANFRWIAAQVAAVLQTRLLELTDVSFGSFDNNRKFTVSLRKVLDHLNHACQCPKCGQPARLEMSHNKGYPKGQFKLKHFGRGGMACWTGTYLPPLLLIPHQEDG